MFWYIIICILMLYPLRIRTAGIITGRKTDRVALGAACILLWLFMAMRAVSVGVDTKYYCYVFVQFSDIPLSEVFTAVTYAAENQSWAFDFEPGYRLINKLVSCFSDAPQAITIFNSTLIMALLYRLVREESPELLLSAWLYITLGIFQTQMNVTRNAIAILIVYNAMGCIRQRRLGRYVLACLLASTIHAAAFVFLPVYWLVNRFRLTLGRGLALLGAACGIGLLYPVIGPYVRMIVPQALRHYFETEKAKPETLMVGLFHGGLFVFCCLLLSRNERRGLFDDCAEGAAMLTLNLCFFGLNSGLADAARMAALFGPYLIVFIPQVLDRIQSPARKKFAKGCVAGLCGIQYILRLCINNIGGTMPYRFFWQ